MCNCLGKHEGFPHWLDCDLWCGLAKSCQRGCSWCVRFAVIAYITAQRAEAHAPHSCEMCALWPWWVKRSLWTMSIRQSSFCFTRRPRGTFKMNSVNSLLWREDNEDEKGQTDQVSWSGWLPPIWRNDPKQNLKRLDLFPVVLRELGELPIVLKMDSSSQILLNLWLKFKDECWFRGMSIKWLVCSTQSFV